MYSKRDNSDPLLDGTAFVRITLHNYLNVSGDRVLHQSVHFLDELSDIKIIKLLYYATF